ncbi:hypothetical protein PUN28_014851 [Cardiocondyla obscurior]|uniref:Uncharacterized protein n=1 Tax=Cardiocondyla obscurior TaxID=286306 RepID=A0AAW2EVQ9_9HYME
MQSQGRLPKASSAIPRGMKFSFSPSDPPVGLPSFSISALAPSRDCESEQAFSGQRVDHSRSSLSLLLSLLSVSLSVTRSRMRTIAQRESQHVADGGRGSPGGMCTRRSRRAL